MKTVVDKRLFWFLKEGTALDLSDKAHLDMYVQHIFTRGKTSDIRSLFKAVKTPDLVESFGRIKNFLPKEVKKFWEEKFGDFNRPTKKDTQTL